MRMIRLYDEENVNIYKKSIKNQVKKKTIQVVGGKNTNSDIWNLLQR